MHIEHRIINIANYAVIDIYTFTELIHRFF